MNSVANPIQRMHYYIHSLPCNAIIAYILVCYRIQPQLQILHPIPSTFLHPRVIFVQQVRFLELNGDYNPYKWTN